MQIEASLRWNECTIECCFLLDMGFLWESFKLIISPITTDIGMRSFIICVVPICKNLDPWFETQYSDYKCNIKNIYIVFILRYL